MVNTFLSTDETIKLSRLLQQAEELYSSVSDSVFAGNRAKNLLKNDCINFLAKSNLIKNDFDSMYSITSPVPNGWGRTLVLNNNMYFDFQKTTNLGKLPTRSSYRNIRSISNEGLRDDQSTIDSFFEESESNLLENSGLRYGIFLFIWEGNSISESAIVFPDTEFTKIVAHIDINKFSAIEPNAEEIKEFERKETTFRRHLKEQRKIN